MKKTIFKDYNHYLYCLGKSVLVFSHSFFSRIAAFWWNVDLGNGCLFLGQTKFRRYPNSIITIGANCKFNSLPSSNLIGVNRPCILSTLQKGAKIKIGEGCGFSGTVIGCALQITLGKNVRCGANTTINDTDWHFDDPRTGPDMPVEIGDNVWLGVNVTVLKGVSIGEGTVVGAGSVVTKSLPAHVVAGGVPAKVIRSINSN